MFLHLGGDIIIPKRNIIAILDLKTASKEEGTREFIQLMKKEGFIEVGGGEAKSLILSTHAVYLSPISSTTLKKRAESLQEMIHDWGNLR